MKLNELVCSLDHAKRLQELHVIKNSYFVWFRDKCKNEWHLCEAWQVDDERFELIAAYTASEIGQMLPFTICMHEWAGQKWPKGKTFYLNEMSGYGTVDKEYSSTIAYHFYLYDDEEEFNPVELIVGPDFSDKNEANARAHMLIYLLEQGIIKNV